jgi:translocation and assembly module TamA
LARFHSCTRGAGLLALLVAMALPAPQVRALERVDFQVSGGGENLDGALRAASVLLTLTPGQATPDDVLASARAEYGRLVGALYAEGHYSAVLSVLVDGREAASIPALDAPGRINRVVVRVDPGPPFRFGQAVVGPLAPKTVLPKAFARGETARSGLIAEAAGAGVDGWRAQGHAKASIASQSIVADHRANTIDADIRLQAGPRLRFGPVTIQGQQRTREGRIRKIAGLPEGKVFDPAEVTRAANRLRRTGTFRSVSIAEDKAVTPPDLLGMTIEVVEEKKRRLSFGVELSSLEGLDLTASWLHRNLLRGAERLKVDAHVRNIGGSTSGIDYGIGVAIDRPATLTPDTTLRFATELGHIEDPDQTADTLTATLGFRHVFSDTLTGRLELGYEYANGTSFTTDGTPFGRFLFRSLTLPVGLTWDRRDSTTDAKRGFYIDAEVKPFLGLGTTGSGARLYGDLRGYRSFGPKRGLVLAARVQAGAVLGSGLLQTPRDDLFLSGGGGTVRGQPYQSLGINVARGPVSLLVGGNRFLAASVEVRTKITDSIGVVGFVDAARIGLDDFFSTAGDWHAGAGLGLRYDTGIGPIRLDVAAPVGGDTGKGAQIYIGLGQAF